MTAQLNPWTPGMGINQSTQQQGQMSYLAISPSPFVSVVKRPDHGLTDSMRSSSSHRSSRSAQDSAYSSTGYHLGRRGEQKTARAVEQKVAKRVEQKVAKRVEQKVCEVKSLNIQESSQPDWIPRVVCDHYSSGVSREQQRLTGYIGRDSSVCSNHDSKHPRRELYGSGSRTCTEVNCSEANMNVLNCAEVNINELNPDEVNTTGDSTILHEQHYMITQDTDRTSHELNSDGAQTNRDCSPSHQQHNCVSTNNEMFHNPTDSWGSLVKAGRIPEVNISPRDVRERKLVQCLKKDETDESGAGGFTCQLSVTELCMENLVEEDQGSGCRDLDSFKEEFQLVERGCSFDEQDHKDGDEKPARDRNSHSQNGACVQQTEQGDSMNGHDGRFPRGTTDTVLSQENKDNTHHLACGSTFSRQISAVASSNEALSFVNGTSNAATSNKHDLYSPLGYSDTSPGESLTPTPNGHDSSGQLEDYSLSPGTNTICESRLQTAQVYVHPRTGEFHSLVFGSFTGDGNSLAGCSRTFSTTQECPPESYGYSMNHTEVSFGTGSFTCSLQSNTDNPSCDFHPDARLRVHVGRAGLFDSFRDSVCSCSLDHTTSRCKVQADRNPEETGQSTQIEKVVIEKQHIPSLELHGSGKDPQAKFQTRKAISSCESCSIATSSMVPVFGCGGGSLCQMCCSHQQSLAQDTNSFSEIACSHSRSQHSCDSWRDSLQKPGTTQKASPCFIDYNSDNCEFSTSQPQQRQLKNNCKCETTAANKDRGNMFMGTQEIETCEEATEHYGLNGKAKVSSSILTFGDKCLTFCSNIIKSQRLAENKIRRTDTQGFHDSAVYNNISSLTPSQTKDKHMARASMGCNSARQQFSEEAGFAGQAETEGRNYANISPGSKQFNSSITKPDIGRRLSIPMGLGGSNQANNCNCAHDDDSGNNRSDLYSSRQNRHQNNARCNGQNLERECNRSEKNRVPQEEEVNAERCLLQIQHNRSLSCDCGDPFKQNYVAYLCCAPEDLSSFGLAFHSTLERWGFRIFIAPRDLELTGPKYDNMTRWLEERCNGKIIVILSKNYEKSDECLFLTHFARTLDPDSKYRNIIPVMIDRDVVIPNVLKGLSIIKYNYDFRCGWLKKKLVNAIAA